MGLEIICQVGKVKMDDLMVSIIVPIYNTYKYLPLCLNSILNQTYKNIEIILIDDGSTDGSEKLCDHYAKGNDKIKVIHKENEGLSVARNVGIDAARGELISFIDSDDFISHDFLERAVDVIKQSNCPLVCIRDFPFLDGQEQELQKKWNSDFDAFFSRNSDKKKEVEIFVWDEILNSILYQHISLTGAQLKIYRRNLFNEIRFPEGRLYEDMATTWKFIKDAGRIAIIHKPLYAYRVRKDSILNAKWNPKMLDCLWIENTFMEEIVKPFPQFYPAVAAAIFRIDRIVLAQMGHAPVEAKEHVWESLCRYRRSVLFDKHARQFERMLAICSYAGVNFFYFILQLFKFCRRKKISLNVRRK